MSCHLNFSQNDRIILGEKFHKLQLVQDWKRIYVITLVWKGWKNGIQHLQTENNSILVFISNSNIQKRKRKVSPGCKFCTLETKLWNDCTKWKNNVEKGESQPFPYHRESD